jgi:serine/threonine protein kinase
LANGHGIVDPRDDYNVSDFLSFIEKLLHVDPVLRFTATEALEHRFLDEYRDYIDAQRQTCPHVTHILDTHIIIPFSESRREMSSLASGLYHERFSFSWYSDRMLFQSISLFDRYLQCGATELYNLRLGPTVEYMLCVYIAIKYFFQLADAPSFEEFIFPEYKGSRGAGLYFEQTLFRYLKYNIYQPTVYETLGQSEGIECILEQYLLVEEFSGTLGDLSDMIKRRI